MATASGDVYRLSTSSAYACTAASVASARSWNWVMSEASLVSGGSHGGSGSAMQSVLSMPSLLGERRLRAYVRARGQADCPRGQRVGDGVDQLHAAHPARAQAHGGARLHRVVRDY